VGNVVQAADQQARIQRLEKELESLAGERDQYLRSLYALLPREEPVFSEEELRHLIHKGIPFEEVIKLFGDRKEG
jgi:hypothetical protein